MRARPRRSRQVSRRPGRVPRRWRWRLAPPRPRGAPGLDTRIRRTLLSWWPWALLAAWAVAHEAWIWAAVLGAWSLACYLVTPVEEPPRYGLDHEFPAGSREFLISIAGATGAPFLPGNRVEILNNGDEFYPAMLQAIREARRSITMEAYIYWAGRTGTEFARALAARAQAGVRVKLLLDAVGSSTIGEDILRALESGGCQLAWYNPVRWYTIGRLNNRNHRKSLIVDGRLAFTGGAGIADQWQGRAQDPNHWRDVQILLEGPAAMPLQAGFARSWLITTGELITGGDYFPPTERAGRVAAQTVLSSPQPGSSPARILHYLSIVCARRSIFIANAYFSPDEAALETLIEARQRGVDVKIIVPGIHNDIWLTRQNTMRVAGHLLKAGIEMYAYRPTMLHQKTMVVDGVWATVGTTNFNSRSFALNEETNVCFHDPALVAELERAFLADLAVSDQLQYAHWRRRGVGARVQELAAQFLKDQS